MACLFFHPSVKHSAWSVGVSCDYGVDVFLEKRMESYIFASKENHFWQNWDEREGSSRTHLDAPASHFSLSLFPFMLIKETHDVT